MPSNEAPHKSHPILKTVGWLFGALIAWVIVIFIATIIMLKIDFGKYESLTGQQSTSVL